MWTYGIVEYVMHDVRTNLNLDDEKWGVGR